MVIEARSEEEDDVVKLLGIAVWYHHGYVCGRLCIDHICRLYRRIANTLLDNIQNAVGTCAVSIEKSSLSYSEPSALFHIGLAARYTSQHLRTSHQYSPCALVLATNRIPSSCV
jgi:hypothetical protein